MLANLPAYLSFVMGDALRYECTLLLIFFLVLNVRRSLHRGVRFYRQSHEPAADRLRAALWKLLRGSS